MTATQQQSTVFTPVLYLAFDLGWTEWKLAFRTAQAQAPRLRTIHARDMESLRREIIRAKERLGVPVDAAVRTCYEAGRDGFWLHRWLLAHGIDNSVVDSASIEVNRRARRAKSDGLDAGKLVAMLMRYHGGETKVWSVCRVPTAAEEDRRHLHRELMELKDERTRQVNRIKGLLANQGLELAKVSSDFAVKLNAFRLWDGSELGVDLRVQLTREYERWHFVDRQVRGLEGERSKRIRRDTTPQVELVRRLLELSGVGLNSAWLLVHELFGWRRFRNRKELAGAVGLTPTPYQSGGSSHEQGITKAGNRRIRRMLVELAWCWLRWQPSSELTQWYERRFSVGQRARKIGIVAVARKLLIALWRWLEQGEVPAGAKLCAWKPKVYGSPKAKPASNE